MELPDQKAVLLRYLRASREALLWKLEGLPERELRLPRTPTGTNLLGIVKHMANVEIGYFGDTFGRPWPTPGEQVPESAYDVDPQADWYATAEESAAGVVDLYGRVATFADATITELPLDATGRVPWWPDERADVTLGQVAVHVLTDLARHCGHADILREQLDGAVGMRTDATNIPDTDWPAYVARLQAIADGA
jgi:uncharacterized damage-inducible protein DinB